MIFAGRRNDCVEYGEAEITGFGRNLLVLGWAGTQLTHLSSKQM